MKVFECTLDILPDEPIGKDRVSRDLVFTDDRNRSTGGDLIIDPLTNLTIKRLSYWVGSCDFERQDLRLLGIHLFNLLFSGQIGRDLKSTYDAFCEERQANPASRPRPRFRLVLKLHPRAKDLADYPWEFLFLPKDKSIDDGLFLAGEDTELILTRFVPGVATMQKIAPEEKLRILVAYCQPSDLSTISPEGRIGGEDVIAKIKLQVELAGNIHVETVTNPTYVELKTAIKVHKPHIFHFVGHGKDGGIYIIRTKEEIEEERLISGFIIESKLIDPATIQQLFVHPKPQLVFLESCLGAKSLEGSGLGNAAFKLVCSGIPAVVAMQFEIGNDDARRFANKFYKLISDGVPIDEAVAEGRQELGTNPEFQKGIAFNDRRFGTPVLYLQTKNAIIVEAKPLDLCPICNKSVEAVGASEVVCNNCDNKLGLCPRCKKLMSLRRGECGNCQYRMASQVAGTERSADTPSSAATADTRVSPEPGAPAPGTVSRPVYTRR